MTTIKIDRGVPMPEFPGHSGRTDFYPWKKMEVGDSFLHSGNKLAAHMLVSVTNKRFAPKRFSSRKTPDGYRIWRVA